MPEFTRREALQLTTGLVLAGSVGQSASAENRLTAPSFEVEDVRTISLEVSAYHGWPTLARRRDGELVVVCSGGRDSHVCPFGRVELIRSRDHGDSWTFGRVIFDGPIDDRDAGILETPAGTLLVTTFTSLAWEPILEMAVATANSDQPGMDPQQLAKWKAAARRLPDAAGRREQLGTWMMRSADGGITWAPPERVPVNSPHGPVSISDGRLLYAGVSLWEDNRRVGVCVSADDGRSWEWRADIPLRPGDEAGQYHELHAVEAADGRWIVQIRNHNPQNSRETLQTHSTDEGRTWAVPYSIGVWGLPSHLVRLSDDRLVMSYGHRRKPLGNQARVSEDHGRSWSDGMIIYGEGTSTDLGYPSTVELSPGRLATVWYERLPDSPWAQLRMARWRLS